MRTWDHFKWWLLFGLIVWLLLVAVFLIDHSRGYSWPMISERIWRTSGEIILLKWVTKYQTLLAGGLAVTGGLATIYAANIALSAARLSEEEQQRQSLIINLALVCEFLRINSYNVINLPVKFSSKYWRDSFKASRSIAILSHELASEILYVLNTIHTSGGSNLSGFRCAHISITSYAGHAILADIIVKLQKGERITEINLIPAKNEFIKILDAQYLNLKLQFPSAKPSSVHRAGGPILSRIDLSGTSYEKA
ncbi:hypothetical protein ECB98_18965 [Brucellaceae bacterium VT-16-1752]|nr:hypothetical protein ECB98_18965 [Brucellaceae bacterium VT-16-1752]